MLENLSEDIIIYIIREDSTSFCGLFAVSKYFNSLCRSVSDWRKLFTDTSIEHTTTYKLRLLSFGVTWGVSPYSFITETYLDKSVTVFRKKYNKKDGPEMQYYKNGKVKLSCTWVRGSLHGQRCKFNHRGRIISTEPFFEGLLDGRKRLYDECTDRLIFDGYYKMGKPIDIHREYYTSGEQKSITMYNQMGQKHGVSKYWNTDGSPREELNYTKDVLNGKCKLWYKKYIANITDAYYDLYKECSYIDGKRKESTTWYMKNGVRTEQILRKRTYGVNMSNSTCYTYYITGTPIKKTTYDVNGDPVTIIKYNADGREQSKVAFGKSYSGSKTVWEEKYKYDSVGNKIISSSKYYGPN